MKPKDRKNPQSDSNNLQISVNSESMSLPANPMGRQAQKSYIEFIQKFDKEIHYQKCTNVQLENSLNSMRIVLKELNALLNKMMDKNYQYLAERQVSQPTAEKQVQLLTAQIDNAKKLIANQDSQITALNNTMYEMEGKQFYEQQLLDQIMKVKDKMPGVCLQSKQSSSDINRNGYVLINQQQDNSSYFRVNILRSDIQRAYERLKRLQEKQKSIAQKERELQQKSYQIDEKLNNCIQKAKQNSFQFTANGTIISLKQKYDSMRKRKEQQQKKNALVDHVSRNNQTAILKKIQQMKKLMSQYTIKQNHLESKLQQITRQTENLLRESKISNKLTQKSFSLRYAQVLLKGERSDQKGKQKQKQQYEDDFQDLQNDSLIRKSLIQKKDSPNSMKKALNIIKKSNDSKYQKSQSMVEMPKQKQNISKDLKPNFEQQERQKNRLKIFHLRRSSANEIKKQKQVNNSVNIYESPKIKLWKKDKDEEMNAEDEKQKGRESEYKVSKPQLNLKRRDQNISLMVSRKQPEEDELIEQPSIKPRFSRLAAKKINQKGTDQYSNYLQQRGRKILGLT